MRVLDGCHVRLCCGAAGLSSSHGYPRSRTDTRAYAVYASVGPSHSKTYSDADPGAHAPTYARAHDHANTNPHCYTDPGANANPAAYAH